MSRLSADLHFVQRRQVLQKFSATVLVVLAEHAGPMVARACVCSAPHVERRRFGWVSLTEFEIRRERGSRSERKARAQS